MPNPHTFTGDPLKAGKNPVFLKKVNEKCYFFLENEGYFKKKYYLCSVIQKIYIN